MSFCVKCGAELINGGDFCVKCGQKQPELSSLCVHCDGVLESGDIFCGYCGKKIGAEINFVSLKKNCPHCREVCDAEETVCRSCGYTFDAASVGDVSVPSGDRNGSGVTGAVLGGIAGCAVASALSDNSEAQAAVTDPANEMTVEVNEITMSATEFAELGSADGMTAVTAEDMTVNLTEVTVDPDGVGGMDPETVMVAAEIVETDAAFLMEEEGVGDFEEDFDVDFGGDDSGGSLFDLFDLFG